MIEYKIINIKKLDFECTRREFEYILYNEFDLDSRYTDNADELEVYIYEDSDKDMLKKALEKYGADEEYVESLFESKKENKLSTDNMKKRFNNTVNESATPEDNRLFVRCFNFVTEENWDESDADYKYLFEDGGLEYLMEEVSRESGIVFEDKNDFLNYVIENQADLTSDELVAVLVSGASANESASTNNSEGVDEGFCYAKLEDLLAEAKEEGRKEALNEAKAWYEDYDYVKPAGISDSEWKELGKKALDWKHGERDENIGACGAEKLRKYYAICAAIKFNGGLSAIEAEAKKRDISLNESNTTIFDINFDNSSVNESKKPLTKEDIKVKKEDLKAAKSAFAEKAKAIKAIVKAKGLGDLLKYGEEFDADKLVAACNEWFAAEGKEVKDKKAEVKGLIKELKKLNTTILVLAAAIEGFKTSKTNESVTSRFASGRKDWKNLKLNEGEEEGSKDDEGDKDDEKKDGEGSDDKESDKKDGEGSDDTKKDGEGGDSDEETEEIDLPAVVITIKKDALDKCKEDMIAAGVEESDIEELESDDEDSDEVDLKVDTNSILALKDYLKDKGIDLEEKLGIEIQEEPDEDDEEGKKDGDDDKKDGEGEGDGDGDDLDGLNDDFFASLGDIGGDEGDNK